jgi:hypothetical protein
MKLKTTYICQYNQKIDETIQHLEYDKEFVKVNSVTNKNKNAKREYIC